MNCKAAGEAMMKHFDRECNDIESAQLKQHFKSCEKCSLEFNGLSEIFGTLAVDGMVEPPQNFELQVMEKVNVSEVERKKATDNFHTLLYSTASLIFAAITIFIALGVRQLALQGDGVFNHLFSSTWPVFYNIVNEVFDVVVVIAKVLVNISITLIKTYYYIFIILFAMLMIIQGMFFSLLKQDRGGIA
jgi:hypothetical protein